MIHTAKQLKDKVKNMSGGNSEVAQALIRTYFMERFLERVSISEYRNNFILKGGMLVASIVGVDMRATIAAQLKAVIDRTVARWLEVKNKEFYYIVTMADERIASADTTIACFRGYADCVEGAEEKGIIIGNGVYEPEKIKSTEAMEKAYTMGKNI